MFFTSFRSCVIVALLLCVAPPAHARQVPHWPYDQLFRESHLVVIAEAETSEPSKDAFPDKNLWPIRIEGIVTTFEVKLILKGSESSKKIRVLHFRIKEIRGLVGVINGPGFVQFATGPVKVSSKSGWHIEKPSYLLFLKKMADGRYGAVTGQTDPIHSVREMFMPMGISPEVSQD
jgi:hypothetical protein